MVTGLTRSLEQGARRVRRLSEGPLRAVSRPIHTAVTRVQLAALTRVDRRRRKLPNADEAADLTARVTMVVKTFERQDTLDRLLQSVRPVFPGRIIVADDSRVPVAEPEPRVEVLALPFNVGLSVGRNAALDLVTSEYVFVTDDDIVFTAATDIVAMVDYLDEHAEVDIIGLELVNLPWWYTNDYLNKGLYQGAAPPLRQWGDQIGGAIVVPQVPNVFLARTASLQAIRWDEELRLVEHTDFFSRASGRLVTVLGPGLRAYHVKTPYDSFYMQHRMDFASAAATARAKWARIRANQSRQSESGG